MSASVPNHQLLLSIVIPTKDRRHYLKSALRSLLGIDSDELEVVVSDNTGSGTLDAELQGFISDPRVKYSHDPRPLSNITNFVKALLPAKGTYICCIGDDDTVNPDIVDICRQAQLSQIEAIVDNWKAYYYWPDFRFKDGGDPGCGKLVVRRFSGQVLCVTSKSQLENNVATGGLGLQLLPKVYLGVVRSDIVQRALQTAAGAELGTCPDMFFGTLLGGYVHMVHLIDYPIVLPGNSSAGAGQWLQDGTHKGELSEAPHLRNRTNFNWPDKIPRFYSAQTFCAESAFKGLLAGGNTLLLERFNYTFLYLVCLAFHPRYRRRVGASLRVLHRDLRAKRMGLLSYHMAGAARAGLSLLEKRLRHGRLTVGSSPVTEVIEGLKSSWEAALALKQCCAKSSITIRWPNGK